MKIPLFLKAAPFGAAAGVSDLPADFDAGFYRSFNEDLPKGWKEGQLCRHYLQFGRVEGRPRNVAEFLKPLEAEFGALPDDFDGATYRLLNADVAQKLHNTWSATEHYIRYGRLEGRHYVNFDVELYRSLNGLDDLLSERDVLIHYKSNRAGGTVAKSGADFMTLRNLTGGGAWVERLNLAEFSIMNWSWVPRGLNKVQAADWVLSEGISKLAPLAFALQFDPIYYREAHPELSALDDQAVYRSWLFSGLERNEAGSAAGRLKQLGLDLTHYPKVFDWGAYARQQGLKKPQPWSTLEHFLHNTSLRELPPVRGAEGRASFFTAAAKSFSTRVDVYALKLLQGLALAGEVSSEVSQVWGDCLFRMEKWGPALERYEAVLTSGQSNVWTLVNAARAHQNLEAPANAAKLLAAYKDKFGGEGLFRQTGKEIVEAIFRQRETQALKLYQADKREDANRLLTDAVEVCQRLWEDIDPIGSAIDVLTKTKVVVLANTDLRQCTHYRVEQKAAIFRQMGLQFEIFSAANDEAFISALPGAAAAIFYRLPAFPKNVRAIEAAREMGIPTYYEIDDLIFDNAYPDPIETYGGAVTAEEYAGLRFGVPLFREAMRRCDYGISSTSHLAAQVAEVVRTGDVFVIRNGLDDRNKVAAAAIKHRLRRDDEVVLFYGSGTKAHNSDFLELVAPAILELFSSNSLVRLVIVGFLALDARFDPFRDRVTQVGFVPNIQAYWSILAEADINLAVLRPAPTTDGKSEIKWLEAAVLMVPSVVSNTATYLDVVEDGVDGLIAGSPEEWSMHLQGLVASAAKRSEIAKAAQRKAMQLYSLKANAVRMRAALSPAFETRRQAAEARDVSQRTPRVLIVNVFFPPQTIGGATRVVRDNVDDFLESASSKFNFAIAATDVAAPEPYRLRVDRYNGAPVFRISTPQEVNMDWRPFNPVAGNVFGRVLEIYKPDLVHFHATQRLTASAVRECRRRKIPFIVTVHDAWWISDYQFLLDERGSLLQPDDVLGVQPPAGVSLGDSLERRRELKLLLKSAAAVVGVSNSFAELYKACDVKAISLPNGIRRRRSDAVRKDTNWRVRLAHVGGQSNHKGYHLVEASLRAGSFPNLQLTVVDHRHTGGEVGSDLWGATPVRYVGMTPQEEMDSFYAEQDVLLAPSIWPESFGLVAREAVAAGLWVVASNRGAMAEEVEDGVNGFVVDVGDPEGLFQVFQTMNETPASFKVSPPRRPVRSAEAQAAELLGLYRKVLREGAVRSRDLAHH